MTAESSQNLEQVLVAATLVAASLAVLFALWQAEVTAALALEPSSAGNENDKEARRVVRSILLYRSLPLLLTSILTFAILVHQLCPILRQAFACWGQACSLDDVKALALVNALIVGLLTLGLVSQFIDLCRHWRMLGGLTKVFPRRDPASRTGD